MMQLQILAENKRPKLITRIWHRLQERLRHPSLRRSIARMIAAVRKKGLHIASQELYELQTHGIVRFPQFVSQETVRQIMESLENLPCFDPWAEEIGEFDLKSIPARTHVAQIRHAPTLAILHELANDPRLIELVTGYFGCRPYLDSIQAWWSISGHDQAEEAEHFHRDNDSIRFLKFFIYLTDVNEMNGPHVFVTDSHISSKLLERRRLSDEEVRAEFGEKIQFLTGKAGDAFMEDTYGIHKGQLPKEGRRLLVQFRYSITESVFRSPVIVATDRKSSTSAITSLINEK